MNLCKGKKTCASQCITIAIIIASGKLIYIWQSTCPVSHQAVRNTEANINKHNNWFSNCTNFCLQLLDSVWHVEAGTRFRSSLEGCQGIGPLTLRSRSGQKYQSVTATKSITIWNVAFMTNILLRSESPSGMCAKLHTVAASNNRDHPTTRSLYYYWFVPLIYGCCSSRTSRSWWIAHSTQRQRRGCNNTLHVKTVVYLMVKTNIGDYDDSLQTLAICISLGVHCSWLAANVSLNLTVSFAAVVWGQLRPKPVFEKTIRMLSLIWL